MTVPAFVFAPEIFGRAQEVFGEIHRCSPSVPLLENRMHQYREYDASVQSR